MLIKNAEIYQRGLGDLRLVEGSIAEIGTLSPETDEPVIDANGGALLPGLNDHHIHFLSYAAALVSMDCSPTAAANATDLKRLLGAQSSGAHWLRGFGYHESVAGDIDRHWLDRHGPKRPIRIQHRSGRLWILNSKALDIVNNLLMERDSNIELNPESLASGRFYDSDQVLSELIGRNLPPVEMASNKLASYGVTGFSDMTPTNKGETFALFADLMQQRKISQNVQLAAKDPAICGGHEGNLVKIHLHENRLPELDQLIARIKASHHLSVPVAIHCVTEIELMFSLGALEEAGTIQGDRIEHASITPEHTLSRIQDMGLIVVTQPGFIAEKGDTYLDDLEQYYHPQLYRCKSFLDQNIGLAASSDAPFGSADPWQAMRAAVQRKTRSGRAVGEAESISPEQALSMYLGSLMEPHHPRQIEPGCTADLCLMAHPWSKIKLRLTSSDVSRVFRAGKVIFQR